MALFAIIVTALLVNVLLILIYILYMSRQHRLLKKWNIPCPKHWPALGNLPDIAREGMFYFHKRLYKEFSKEKVYGYHEPGKAIMVVRDLDMVKDILGRHFQYFPNHRVYTDEEPFGHVIPVLKDETWRHVRRNVSPIFTHDKLKRMCTHLHENVRVLVSNIKTASDNKTDLELKDAMSCFTIDAIANSGFGIKIDAMNNRNTQFEREAKNLINSGIRMAAITVLFPFAIPLLKKIGRGVLAKDSLDFFSQFIKQAAEQKQHREKNSNRHDFIQLMIEAEKNPSRSRKVDVDNVQMLGKSLSLQEIQGSALSFILAGYDSVSTVLAFTLHLLAHHPQCCQKVQEELDTVLAGQPPSYDTVQKLTYLDMCVLEAMRLYPPGAWMDRECKEECIVGGITIPKDVVVVIPVAGIHSDPEYWPEPDKFDPERFTPENKAKRHCCAYLSFGRGPRCCIGMRLALLIIKLSISTVLQTMTPVPCSKSVYNVTIANFLMKSKEGLWVKFVERLKE